MQLADQKRPKMVRRKFSWEEENGIETFRSEPVEQITYPLVKKSVFVGEEDGPKTPKIKRKPVPGTEEHRLSVGSDSSSTSAPRMVHYPRAFDTSRSSSVEPLMGSTATGEIPPIPPKSPARSKSPSEASGGSPPPPPPIPIAKPMSSTMPKHSEPQPTSPKKEVARAVIFRASSRYRRAGRPPSKPTMASQEKVPEPSGPSLLKPHLPPLRPGGRTKPSSDPSSPTKEKKAPVKEHAPKTKQRPVSYMAMLDFGRQSSTQPVRATVPEMYRERAASAVNSRSTKEKRNTVDGRLRYVLSSPKAPQQDARWSASSPPPPAVLRSSPSVSPPETRALTGLAPDRDYFGGYLVPEQSEAPVRPHHGRSSSIYSLEEDRSPRVPYVAPYSPDTIRSDKRTVPRIVTNLDMSKSVNPLTVAKDGTMTNDLGKSLDSAEVQSSDLTDILNNYLDDVVKDAIERGVMSSELEEYLKSPTIMDEWDNDEWRSLSDKDGERRTSSIGMVRGALEDEDE